MEDNIKFMDHMWLNINDGIVTVGINDEAAEDLSDDIDLNLPEEDDIVMRGKICGYIESANGNINLYSPVSGTIIELNEAVTDNPDLIIEDPNDEGWLFKVEADDPSQLEKYTATGYTSSDDDDDEDEDDEDDSDEDYDEDEDSTDGDEDEDR